MRRIFYEEDQQLRNNPWIYVFMLAVTMSVLLPLIQGIYQQVIEGRPWGDEPMSDNALIALSVIIFALCCGVTWMLTSMKLHVIIDSEGVHYRFFPNEPRWRTIRKEEIIDFDIHKTNLFNRFGHHRQWFIKTKRMNVNGRVLLSLRLKSGKKIKLGSRNPEGLEWAMKKLITEHELM
jgi:hypothetical protein